MCTLGSAAPLPKVVLRSAPLFDPTRHAQSRSSVVPHRSALWDDVAPAYHPSLPSARSQIDVHVTKRRTDPDPSVEKCPFQIGRGNTQPCATTPVPTVPLAEEQVRFASSRRENRHNTAFSGAVDPAKALLTHLRDDVQIVCKPATKYGWTKHISAFAPHPAICSARHIRALANDRAQSV